MAGHGTSWPVAPGGNPYPGDVFSRRSESQPDESTADVADQDLEALPEAQRPKGRPTPSRKDSEAHRKQTLKVPADPKAAKKAMKERERQARMEARAGLMAGDPKYLPPRDQGPAKAYTRDFIDGKRRLSEFFIFLAVGILIVGFLRNPEIQNVVSLIWFVVVGLVILEVVWILFSLDRQLKQRWPDKQDRKGCLLYATLRTLQIRRLRIPPPRIKPGGAPVEK